MRTYTQKTDRSGTAVSSTPVKRTAGSCEVESIPPQSRASFQFGTIPIFPKKAPGADPGLLIGSPGDKYEQEADQAAARSSRLFASGAAAPGAGSGAPFTPSPVSASAGVRYHGAAAPTVHRALSSSGRPLPSGIQTRFERFFTADLSDVRIHHGPEAAGGARALGASAFTTGSQIVFASGQYQPQTDKGRSLLAHELAHVVQQGAGQGTNAVSLLQMQPAAESAECLEPRLPEGGAPTSLPEGATEVRGDTIWVLRLWDFERESDTMKDSHVQTLDAFTTAASERVTENPEIESWSVTSVVGHASPEGEEEYNSDLALRRADGVVSALAVSTTPTSSGERCGQDADRSDYAYFRAVDITIDFLGQTLPPETSTEMPKLGTSERDAGSDTSKALKSLAGGRLGVSAGGADLTHEIMITRLNERYGQELQEQIDQELDRLRPQAEQMLMDDPHQPVYAIVHTQKSRMEMGRSPEGGKKPVWAGYSLAEDITLSRERVFRTYRTSERLSGSPETLVRDHRIESVEYKLVSE